MARAIDRLGRATRQIAGDDTLVGTIVAVVIILLFGGVIVALSVFDAQKPLQEASDIAKESALANGHALSFMQGCLIPEKEKHTHPRIPDQFRTSEHDHSCFEHGVNRTASAVRRAAVQVDCRHRRADAGLPPPPDDRDCSWDFLVSRGP